MTDRLGSVRKNLAVHVSLSSCLHNVKERTPVNPFRGRRQWKQSFRNLGTETRLRLPGSNPALSVIAEQWERLALDVVSEAGSIRDVTVCQHPIFNFLRTIRRLLAENPKDQISLFFQWFPPVRCRFAAAPSQRWAGYMGGVPDCQRSKVTKATFFASGPSAAPAPVVESLIARAFRESHLVFESCTFNRRSGWGVPCDPDLRGRNSQ